MNFIIAISFFALGAAFGLAAMCCFIVAGEGDRQREKENKEQEADTE